MWAHLTGQWDGKEELLLGKEREAKINAMVSLEQAYRWAPDTGSELKGPLDVRTVCCFGVLCQWVYVWWAEGSEREGVFGLLCWVGPKCCPGLNEVEGHSIPHSTFQRAQHYSAYTRSQRCFIAVLSQVSFDELIKFLYILLHKHGILMNIWAWKNRIFM